MAPFTHTVVAEGQFSSDGTLKYEEHGNGQKISRLPTPREPSANSNFTCPGPVACEFQFETRYIHMLSRSDLLTELN